MACNSIEVPLLNVIKRSGVLAATRGVAGGRAWSCAGRRRRERQCLAGGWRLWGLDLMALSDGSLDRDLTLGALSIKNIMGNFDTSIV
ncbi:hypothetical protein VIN30_07055 [Adlercreutzia sp. R7]|uniref:Uncharacterized protein n=1 Tax=Adlercreutzia wanghongyangiae TaxID=3111451 RepID=A0ABU6IIK3_9ACTN|nr:hypothetical protein [Adlercreutzia sp. R7]